MKILNTTILMIDEKPVISQEDLLNLLIKTNPKLSESEIKAEIKKAKIYVSKSSSKSKATETTDTSISSETDNI